MTSIVNIKAHCGEDKFVEVRELSYSRDIDQKHTVQNGQSYELTVYGDMEITISEVDKEELEDEYDDECEGQDEDDPDYEDNIEE